MKDKKMKKGLCVFASCCAVALTASFGVAIASSADVVDGWSSLELSSEYGYNESFTVADRTYTKNGVTYDASCIVRYPDGSVTSAKEISLNAAGYYTLEYTAKAGDKVYASSEKFLVNYPKYYVGKEKSSVSYGTPDRSSTPGVMAKLAAGDSLTFTQLIDFSKITIDDTLVEAYATPSVPGALDFAELVFTFTDSQDSSVYFQVHYYGYEWTWNTYVAANGNNQSPAGLHQSQGIHFDDGYGLWCATSFNSVYSGSVIAPDTNKFFVAMDYASKEIKGPGFLGQKNIYCDLDDPEYFSEAWTGFPSGKARLSVSAGSYKGTYANICISSVYGIDDLSENLYLDTEKPVISVEDEYDGDMPYGIVGKPYAVPSASAYDEYAGACSVKTSVVYNYGMENASNVFLKDGKFTPDKEGTYGIVYDSYDLVGNLVREVRYVNVYTTAAAASFDIPTEKVTSADVGSFVEIPEIDVSSIVGGSGKKMVETFAKFNGERQKAEGGFRAEKVGTYKVVYVVTDYVGQTFERSYDVVISVGDSATNPVIEKDVDVYPVYISGNTYALPEYYAYVYDASSESLSRVLCDVRVTDASGERVLKSGEKTVLTVANNGDEIEFDVVYNGVTLSSHKATGILAWTVESGRKGLRNENYFVGEGFSKEKTDGGIVLTSTGENFSFVFANALSAKGGTFTLSSWKGYTSASRLVLTLSDVYSGKSLQISLYGDADNAYVETLGKTVALKGTSLQNASLDISYSETTLTVGKESVSLADFSGFENDKVFLSVSFEKVSKDAGFTFVSIGNTIFNAFISDRFLPNLYVEGETGGTFSVGSTYVLRAPVIYDVYSPNVVASLTVTDASGNVVKDVNGVSLNSVDPSVDYTLKLDSIGQYLVSYSAVEDAEFIKKNTAASLVYILNVSDEIAPSISWKGSFVTEAKVGDTLVFPDYEVLDNYTASEDIIVRFYVETPVHQLIMLSGNSITVNHVGVYELRVMVVDAAGNLTSETHYVNVK